MASSARVHASAIAYQGGGALILGASGSGKSSLALQLMALGSDLISDDQTDITLRNGRVWASAPAATSGLIEARGVGLLRAEYVTAAIDVVINLDVEETQRLPHRHTHELLGTEITCLHKVNTPAWPFSILQYLRGGRRQL